MMRKFPKVFFKITSGSLGYFFFLAGDEVGVYSPPTSEEQLSTYSQMNAKLESYENSQLGNQIKVDHWWKEAFNFAQNYLKKIDKGDYAESWGAGDKVIQTIIGKCLFSSTA